jgi:hypothetical protein
MINRRSGNHHVETCGRPQMIRAGIDPLTVPESIGRAGVKSTMTCGYNSAELRRTVTEKINKIYESGIEPGRLGTIRKLRWTIRPSRARHLLKCPIFRQSASWAG